jgi:FkbM family methyltransferase
MPPRPLTPPGSRSIREAIRRATGKLAVRVRPEPVRTLDTGPLAGMRVAFPVGFVPDDGPEAYEPDVTAALERLTQPGFVCADLGAHVGYFTLLLARLTGPEGRVFAFEAAADNARAVRRNVKLNGVGSRVTVETAAVVERSAGRVPLFPGRAGGSMEWTTDAGFAVRGDPASRAPAEAMRVDSIALDDYLPPNSRLDLVKMDIEGAEGRALRGMRRLLREARPVVVLEFHREVGWPAIPVLVEAGYSFATLDRKPLAVKAPDDVPYQLIAEPPR